MTSSLFAKVSLISVLVLSLVLFLWNLSQRKETPSPSTEQKTSTSPLRIKGLSHSTYFDDKLIASIEADEFKVNQRRFWVFNIRPFNEATLTNARLEFHFYDDMPSEKDLLSSVADILSLDKQGKVTSKEMGLITRGVIKGLVFGMYKGERLSILIKAQKAYIDFKRKKINMIRVSMENVSSRKLIKSRSIIWNSKNKVFEIPGKYMAQTPKGQASGKGIKVDLDFTVTPL